MRIYLYGQEKVLRKLANLFTLADSTRSSQEISSFCKLGLTVWFSLGGLKRAAIKNFAFRLINYGFHHLILELIFLLN